MIARLSGKLISKQPPALVIDVNGVGYDVQAPMSSIYQLPELQANVTLLIHTHVREDSFILFGFVTDNERDLFRQLIKVSGVGAKMALTILSGISAAAFYRSVQEGDITTLVKLPGVGKKTAERLVVEMKDKLKDQPLASATDFIDQTSDTTQIPIEEATAALISLGYKPAEAVRMVSAVAKTSENPSVESLIKTALQQAVKA